MIHFIRTAAALIALTLLAIPAAFAAEQVDLLLVLSSDVSRSVDHPKFLLQRDGYAAAVTNPQVLDAIKSGPHGKIALCFVEWSGYGAQKLVIDWTVIDGAASRAQVRRPAGRAAALVRRPHLDQRRHRLRGRAARASAPFEAPRRTIDVSGDGTNNAGRDVRLARDEALAKGIMINGLVILSDRQVPWNAEHTNPPGGLENYYRDNVIGGPGRLRHGGGEFPVVRPRHHQEDDRRDRHAASRPRATCDRAAEQLAAAVGAADRRAVQPCAITRGCDRSFATARIRTNQDRQSRIILSY